MTWMSICLLKTTKSCWKVDSRSALARPRAGVGKGASGGEIGVNEKFFQPAFPFPIPHSPFP